MRDIHNSKACSVYSFEPVAVQRIDYAFVLKICPSHHREYSNLREDTENLLDYRVAFWSSCADLDWSLS